MGRNLPMSLLTGGVVFAACTVLIFLVALEVIAGFDPSLHDRLRGRTMANPDWQPWWGYYLLWGCCAALGALAGWMCWRSGPE